MQNQDKAAQKRPFKGQEGGNMTIKKGMQISCIPLASVYNRGCVPVEKLYLGIVQRPFVPNTTTSTIHEHGISLPFFPKQRQRFGRERRGRAVNHIHGAPVTART